MIICPKCGSTDDILNNNYCPRCGASLTFDSTPRLTENKPPAINIPYESNIIMKKPIVSQHISSPKKGIQPNPYMGFIISLIIPGLSQIAMGQFFKGIILACIAIGAGFSSLGFGYILCGILSAIDVFVLTKRMNEGKEIKTWEFFYQESDPPLLCNKCNITVKSVWRFCPECGSPLHNNQYIHLKPDALWRFNMAFPGIIHMYIGQELKGLILFIIALILGFFSSGILYLVIGFLASCDLGEMEERLKKGIKIQKWDTCFNKITELNICSNSNCQSVIEENWHFCPACKRNLAKN
jgi:TM2 domain-containing membrane protein YozV